MMTDTSVGIHYEFLRVPQKCSECKMLLVIAVLDIPYLQKRKRKTKTNFQQIDFFSLRHMSAPFNNIFFKVLFTRDILTHNIAIKRYFRGIDFYWPR